MSDELGKTIERMEQWVECWQPHMMREFIADLNALIGTAKAAISVAATLENAERFDLRPLGDYQGEGMVRDDKRGEWAEAKVLDTVLAILQEGQQ